MDIGIDSLQAARYITGEEPVEINARMYSTPGEDGLQDLKFMMAIYEAARTGKTIRVAS